MTLKSVITEICSFVGVRPPQGSVMQPPLVDRTAWEFVNLANEMAQRIAYDTRDWQALRKRCNFSGAWVTDPDTGALVSQASFPLPSDWQRMLLSANVWRSSNTNVPMSFVSDPDDWLRTELQGYVNSFGEWIIENNAMQIRPALAPAVYSTPYWENSTSYALGVTVIDKADNTFWKCQNSHTSPAAPQTFAQFRAANITIWLTTPSPPTVTLITPAETVTFYYMANNCVKLASGGYGKTFMADDDVFILPERLLKLAMIWQWKANKGATYAEDLANYEDALSRVAGNDKPSPILIGPRAVSSWDTADRAGNYAY